MPTHADARRPLTKRAVDAARYEGAGRRPFVLWDVALRGFGLRVQPTGRKSFALFYRTTDGTKRLVTVGRYPEMTLDEARRKARRMLGQVADGADPAEERRRSRQAATFAELATAYLADHARPRKRSAYADEQRIRDYLTPAWGSRKAAKIRRADVAELHRKVGAKTPYAANRCLALVSVMFTWAERNGYVPEGHPNPARGVPHFREESRDRWLSPDEVRRLVQALEAEPVYVRGFFWLALLTGCRKRELLTTRWADVDLRRAVLRLPDTKAGRRHYVPLAAPARRILEALPREAGNPYVFPGQRAGSHLVNVEKAWRRARTTARVEDARFHDLRRTVGSWLAQGGASLPLIGAVLNQTSPAVTEVYARLSDAGVRDALERHAEAIVAAAGLPDAPGVGAGS